MRRSMLWTLFLVAAAGRAGAAPLTASDAVRIALLHSTQATQADASVLNSKSGLWSAYAGVLPNVSGSYSVSHSWTDPTDDRLSQTIGPATLYYQLKSSSSTTTSPTLSGRWSVLDMANIHQLRSAQHSLRASRLSRTAARNDIALQTRELFYTVVRNIHLADVAAKSLKLSRDNERRVHALFEVGSVSKSDLLKAKVTTAQGQVDSLVADHAVTNSRIALAEEMGVNENGLGEVDTTLDAQHQAYDEAAVLNDARAQRPDVQSADASVRAAELGVASARWSRLPFVSASASATFNPKTDSKNETVYFDSLDAISGTTSSQHSTTKAIASYNASIALNWDIFDLGNDARSASARAALLDARATRDALVRNLESEVHQAMLGDQEAIEREALARQALESAAENYNLVQQKYNVGSATILDLTDAQVQLQTAQSDLVSALAAIRVAEATLERVRGRGE